VPNLKAKACSENYRLFLFIAFFNQDFALKILPSFNPGNNGKNRLLVPINTSKLNSKNDAVVIKGYCDHQ